MTRREVLIKMFQVVKIDYIQKEDRFTGLINLPNKAIAQALADLKTIEESERLTEQEILDEIFVHSDPATIDPEAEAIILQKNFRVLAHAIVLAQKEKARKKKIKEWLLWKAKKEAL